MKKDILAKRVGELLIRWGITPELKGFQYIIDAVCLWDRKKRITEIYYEIADNRNDSWTAVERSIRHAFSGLDFNRNEVKSYFGNIERKNQKLISVIAWKINESEIGGSKDGE